MTQGQGQIPSLTFRETAELFIMEVQGTEWSFVIGRLSLGHE